jgi:hypothetical protein
VALNAKAAKAVKKKKSPQSKMPSVKKGGTDIVNDKIWKVVSGELARSPGRPTNAKSLFKFVGEKIPYQFLNRIKSEIGKTSNGVYIVHDSMGYPRYIGRGNIFNRLTARFKAQPHELVYFSFFVVEEKIHEREIETIMIRAAGPLLDFNNRKIRNDIQPGDVRDFEAGTRYVERQKIKGPKPSTKKPRAKAS